MSQCWQHALYHVRILQFIHHKSPLDSVILLLTVSLAHAQYVTIQANLCLRSHFGHTPDLNMSCERQKYQIDIGGFGARIIQDVQRAI